MNGQHVPKGKNVESCLKKQNKHYNNNEIILLFYFEWSLSMSYHEQCQIYNLLGTLNMHVNDEYSSYTNTYAIMNFLLTMSMHLNNFKSI